MKIVSIRYCRRISEVINDDKSVQFHIDSNIAEPHSDPIIIIMVELTCFGIYVYWDNKWWNPTGQLASPKTIAIVLTEIDDSTVLEALDTINLDLRHTKSS